jgi:hypothetical protein
VGPVGSGWAESREEQFAGVGRAGRARDFIRALTAQSRRPGIASDTSSLYVVVL